jgi:solute carrier family 25 (mitochondrial phosphate transporter), member 23/24/25/41
MAAPAPAAAPVAPAPSASASGEAQAKRSPGYLMFLQSVAGAGSGAVTKTATAPLERIKIIFQIQAREGEGEGGGGGGGHVVTPLLLPCPFRQGMSKADLVAPKYTGIAQTVWLVTKEEGPMALWKGNGACPLRPALPACDPPPPPPPFTLPLGMCAASPGANVLRVIPVYGLKFAFNDSFKAMVAGPGKHHLTTSQLLWVGTLAGLFQTILTYPLETVRTRLSLGAGQGVAYKGITDCVKQMVASEGPASL